MNELLQDVFQTVAREGVDQGSGAIRSKKSVCPGGGPLRQTLRHPRWWRPPAARHLPWWDGHSVVSA